MATDSSNTAPAHTDNAGAACPGRRRRPGVHCSVARPWAALVALSTLLPPGLAAQYPDARLVPRGVLRIAFEPVYFSYGERFDVDGNVEPLGTDFSDDVAGVRLTPTMWSPQDAIGSIIGDAGYTINAGVFRTTLDADIRRFPLNLDFGISRRLTLSASIPLVSTRVQVNFVVDTTGSDMGVNLVSTGQEEAVRDLLLELEAGAALVESQIAAGAYGCPASQLCADAQDLVSRTRMLTGDLVVLTGVFPQGGVNDNLPPFTPRTSSTAGQAVLAAVEGAKAELESFGATPLTGSLPLPDAPVDAATFNNTLTAAGFGYTADSLAFVKYHLKLGDAEVGLRWGALQGENLRAVLTGIVRLPTGTRDLPENFVDIGSGDRQTDVALGAEAVWQPGSVLALAARVSYTMQLGDNLPRRITSHTRPIAIAATQQDVGRNLGDVFEAGLYPALRLSRSFVAYGSVYYYYKNTDRFSLTGPFSLPDDQLPTAIEDLEFETGMRSLSFGAGLHYYADRGAGGPSLPIEAGIDYRTAFQGSGGLTPKATRLTFYLRLYWRLFGERERPEPEQPATPDQQ